MGHVVVTCKSELDKFLVLYAFLKLEILNGKTLIMASTVEQGYKIKMFLEKFQLRSYVVNPDQTKTFKRSVVHFFNIGQYSILILVAGTVRSLEQKFGDILNVVNFDFPRNWGNYKEAADLVSFDNGSVLTFEYCSSAPEKFYNPDDKTNLK
jgi:superfamily II DNA/RNA helicase